jgi:ABC-type uncharacterized transport system substrate-binding protein
LMRLQVDLIVATGPEVALQAVVGASRSIPIVIMAVQYDPIARGYVSSLARPGGNITGVFYRQPELAAKQLELLTQTFPEKSDWPFSTIRTPPISSARPRRRLGPCPWSCNR